MAEEAVNSIVGDRVSKSELAYDWLRRKIARHEYGPGYRLVLAEIAAELGMSVVPVREAIRRLEAERLVTFERNVGARVAMVDENEYLHAMQTLGVTEGIATALSAPALTAANLGRARVINDRMVALLDSFDAHTFTMLNQQFHSELFECCPNPQILELVRQGWTRLSGLRDSTFTFIPGRARQSVEEHEHILSLIEAKADPLEIELAARNHRWATMRAFLERTEEKP
ncbi:DNA-binding transcriptional regulator, GntR family [Amycolatopsis xylanica]|uniref:DNA-binding transcriptional regulator, GntR family n=1 Tax=Amycolatopsis xylanica TaxID=589385 RepID=A0A1H3KB02_9PSEU|nr:GntR family transcriptional regulator [Amycolatopsis xylanica]SDY49331.1 DNA-binding transcriptional regulator, GntR family [Amycolatopsis xylanica]